VELRGYLKGGNNGKEMANGAYFMIFYQWWELRVCHCPLLSCCSAAVLCEDLFVAPQKCGANPGLANQIS
jgi:hypothetical protein